MFGRTPAKTRRAVRRRAVRAVGLMALVALMVLCACSGSASGLDAGTGLHSCADCAAAFTCCGAVLASEGKTTAVCALSEQECQGLDLNDQREYIFNCDSYLLDAPADAAACH